MRLDEPAIISRTELEESYVEEDLDQIRSAVDQTRAALAAKISVLESKLHSKVNALNPAEYVKTRPLSMLAVAVVCGVLLGLLARKHPRHA